jgi:predicted O-methyltransferase YrrM
MQNSKSIFGFLLKSKGRHGIHSPFVFDFVDNCLTTKVDKNFLTSRKKWLQKVKNNREQFKINDLGAGSRQMGAIRSVSDLARNASSKGLYGEILWKIAHHYKPTLLLELGTSIGTGSIHLKSGNPAGHLITVEGCDAILSRASQQFDDWNLSGITTICSPFDDFVKLPALGTYDLIFLDGNHSGKATMNYIDSLFEHTHSNTAFILDDIRWSEDMWDCWNYLVTDPRFHVTIDLGRMGILWRREEQTKEQFTIRPKIFKTRLF